MARYTITNRTSNETCNFDVKILPVDDDVASGIKQAMTINYGSNELEIKL